MHLRDSLIPKYSELVYNGCWFLPERCRGFIRLNALRLKVRSALSQKDRAIDRNRLVG
jgi:hypothetical protein